MDRFKELASSCACGVYLTINEHRDYGKTAKVYIEEIESTQEEPEPVANPIVRDEMIKRDTIVNIRFYPATPIGFEEVFHYDLDAALDEALRIRKGMSWPMVPVWPLL